MTSNIVCGCHNVTLEDVKKEIKNGVTTFEALQEKTKIGTDCAPCREQTEKLFNHLYESRKKQ